MIFSEAHNCVVYDHANPNLVVASIHGARRLNGHQVVVPADLFSLQLARQLGLPVPSLVDRSYDWPAHGIKPFEHQKITTAFLTMHPRCFVLSDMGTGKTLSTLWAADWLMNQGAVKKALIISPLSTLDATWRNEVFRHFLGRRKSITVHGTREQRLKALEANVDFYIINHDGVGIGSARRNGKLELGDLGRVLRDRSDINLVIVDEVSAYKDSQTLRSRLLRQITDGKPYLWAMSGTPTPNAPTDAYGLMRLMNNHRGESFASFQERTMLRVSQFKWVPKPTATEIVHKALQPAIRYNRDDCIDLPDVTYETREVEFSDTQKKAYETLKKELSLVMKNGDRIDAVNEAVLRMKLLQISTGAIYGPDREVYKTDAGPRIDALKEVVTEAGGKILVFAPFTSVVNLLYVEMKRSFGENAVARVYGSTAQGARNEVFRSFQNDSEPRVIVADPRVMSHGLTLTAANTVVWFGATDRLETYLQANARINRPGQRKKMLIVRLVSSPIEKEIFKRLEGKESLQGTILKMVEG